MSGMGWVFSAGDRTANVDTVNINGKRASGSRITAHRIHPLLFCILTAVSGIPKVLSTLERKLMNFTEIVKVNVTYLKATNIPDKAILTGRTRVFDILIVTPVMGVLYVPR